MEDCPYCMHLPAVSSIDTHYAAAPGLWKLDRLSITEKMLFVDMTTPEPQPHISSSSCIYRNMRIPGPILNYHQCGRKLSLKDILVKLHPHSWGQLVNWLWNWLVQSRKILHTLEQSKALPNIKALNYINGLCDNYKLFIRRSNLIGLVAQHFHKTMYDMIAVLFPFMLFWYLIGQFWQMLH